MLLRGDSWEEGTHGVHSIGSVALRRPIELPHSPSIIDETAVEELVRQLDHAENDEHIQGLTEHVLPEVDIVMVEDAIEEMRILVGQTFTRLLGNKMALGLQAEFRHFTSLQMTPQVPRQPKYQSLKWIPLGVSVEMKNVCVPTGSLCPLASSF